MPENIRTTLYHVATVSSQLVWAGLVALSFLLAGPTAVSGKTGSPYLYHLASFDGPVESLWARLTIDEETGEVYSLNRRKSLIQVFNPSAMLVYSFGDGAGYASVVDLTAGHNGELYLVHGAGSGQRLLHLDFKGDLIREIDLQQIPQEYLPFRIGRLEFRHDKLYLLDVESLALVILDTDGQFVQGYKIREKLTALAADNKTQRERAASLDFNGFCVDSEGAMFFTAPTAFAVFRMEPDGTIRGFGSSGSGPGKFGVVAGVDVDSEGTIYLTDRLRSVVIVYDRDFRFLYEFGGRGGLPENLIAPDDVAIDDKHGRLYVSQAANRGVSVFRLKKQ